MARIGFLGLGRMGRGMAARLVAAGHQVHAYNRSPGPAGALAAQGATIAGSPADAARGADAVIAMVADDEASRAVWLGPGGALAACPPGTLVIECSTLSRPWVLDLAAAARERGLRYLDCPVTGLPDAAAEGRLTLLVGAATVDLDAARPLLAPLATEVVHFGPAGAGTAYKLIVNLLGAVQIASAAEALAIAGAAGLDLDLVARTLATGQAASPQVVRTTARMVRELAGEVEPVTFSTALRHKDSRYAIGLAEHLGVAVPFGAQALAGLDEALRRGWGEVNETAVHRLAGRPLTPPADAT